MFADYAFSHKFILLMYNHSFILLINYIVANDALPDFLISCAFSQDLAIQVIDEVSIKLSELASHFLSFLNFDVIEILFIVIQL